ncbi:MAG TPA: hypothetical protein VIH37_11035, partial [Candidatus Limnocylindrales bacterium]
QYLAAAPSSIKGWARAQAASLDEAYLQLTDPVGLEGSALSSPTRPPTVVPGGPATPPARREPVPAVEAAIAAAELPSDATPDGPTAEAEVETTEAFDDTDTDDVDALFASVTPGAHRDLTSGGKPDKTPVSAAVAAAPAATVAKAKTTHRQNVKPGQNAKPAAATPPASSGPWKAVAIVASGALLVALLAFAVVPFVFNLGASGSTANAPSAQPSASQGVDMAQVSALMQKIAANPKDTDSLQQLGDLYYQASDYTSAGTFYDKLLAVDPKNVKGLLARGAVYYNAGAMTNAKKDWNLVISIDPKNVEAHYDLGFLALNQASPDWSTVQKEWQLVISLDPGSDVANTVQQHLDALVAASMIPAPSGSPSAS